MKIYLWCIPTGRISQWSWHPEGDVMGYALCEDGRGITSHLSSDRYYSQADMGLTSNRKHNLYQDACPDGYELEWVEDVESHEGVKAAMVLNEALFQQSQAVLK